MRFLGRTKREEGALVDNAFKERKIDKCRCNETFHFSLQKKQTKVKMFRSLPYFDRR